LAGIEISNPIHTVYWAINQEKKETYMSKNLTLKGAAFGALVALSISAVAPANAAGLADNSFVSLVPTTGTEYSVIAGDAKEFKLSANEATSIAAANRNVKFLITDTSAAIEPNLNETTHYSLTIEDWSADAADDLVTFVSTGHGLVDGDVVVISGLVLNTDSGSGFTESDYSTAVVSDASYIVDVTGTDTFTVTETITADVVSTDDDDTDGVLSSKNVGSLDLVRSKRATDNSYVVDSGSANSTGDELLTLVQADGTVSRTVTVTAWVDANGNRLIDSTEYASPTRTVKFVTATDLVTTTSLTPIVGDDALNAKVSFTPTLNGEQELAQDDSFLNVGFTRQDEATVLYANDSNAGVSAQTSVWNDTTKAFTVKVLTSADSGTAGSSTVDGDTDGGWTLDGADDATPSAITHVSGVLTATSTAHKLRVGDKVLFGSSITSTVAATQTLLRGSTAFTVASVPSADTFTVAVEGSSTIAGTLDYTVETYTATSESIVDRVFAGTYTAQAYLAGTAAGAKATTAVAASTASKVTATTTASASVQGKTFTAAGTNTVKVKTGTTSVDVAFTVTDADGVAVTAGRPVVLTLSNPANDTFKVNGKSTTDTVYTDASGQVKATVTAATAIANAAVSLDAVAEGGPTSGVDLTWEDAVVGIVNLSGTAGAVTASSATPTFTIVKGGSYTLSLGVADQFNTAVDASLYRFEVTGNGISEGYKSLVGGKADVTITDTLGSTLSTVIKLQKATAGVYATTHTWTVATNLTTAPAILLGASGSTLYGSAVDVSAEVALKEIVEIDKRSSTAVTPAYGTAANYLVLNGQVASSLTSVGQAGAVVTVSGASNILFENDQVTKKGSLSFVADGSGKFEVKAYSTTAQKDSVITFTANGKSATIKVTFTGVSTSVKKLTITPNAATYIPGQTVLYTVKLTDNLGNPVNTTAPAATPAEAYITVSYAGPGIISQTLPVETDASGEAQVRIVTGVVDTQAAVLTVKYDQNYDGDFVDTYDLTATSTVYAAGTQPGANTPVAAASGSTGKFYVSATNAANRTVVVKVAGKFVKSFVPGSASKKVVAIAATKGSKAVTVFVGGKLALTKTVTVK
jgi:hypothetical protein